jgi:hypothetical protein
LRFRRLTGCRHPIVEAAPVVDRFRVGHRQLQLGFGFIRRSGVEVQRNT